MRRGVRGSLRAVAIALCMLALPSAAGVLPEDRSDVLYHSYDGGGIQINGPSILVRKNFGEKVSLAGNYYVDTISSASIDVMSTASPYEEERTQNSLGLNYLRGKTGLSVGYTTSVENDFDAESAHLSISQDLLGDLTTVTLGYSRGWDVVRKTGDEAFMEEVDRRHYRLGLSQVLTKNLLMSLAYETISDEGFLNNPYRSVRYLDPDSGKGYSFEPELYPRTRTSNAASLKSRYYLPFRAALHAEYRYYTDTWGIGAHSGEIGYTHPADRGLTFDFRFRYYTQNAADFYSDLFPREMALNFRARDKELSTFASQTIGLGVSYEFARDGWGFIDRGTLNFSYDHFLFDYEDFRDITTDGAPGDEPLYNFSADVLTLFVSFWY